MTMERWWQSNEEVSHALTNNQPVVALESTIIAHGMPWPQNLETALALEATVRTHGAVPATIGIIDGEIRIGLSPRELEDFAQSGNIAKISRRDLPVVVASKGHGATTVAATMICAHMAGIQVFATGGIGGVHRGGEHSMDISADLTELARTSVAVVCAGAKSILDIGRTLEYLETAGVPIIGYQTDRFPAFYCRDSGFGLDAQMDSADQIAHFLHTKWSMGLVGGVLIGNPVPHEMAMPESVIEAAINAALKEAEARDIAGKEVTPFLLDRIKQLTSGSSLETNIALVKNNAALAAQIARNLPQAK